MSGQAFIFLNRVIEKDTRIIESMLRYYKDTKLNYQVRNLINSFLSISYFSCFYFRKVPIEANEQSASAMRTRQQIICLNTTMSFIREQRASI